MNYIKSIWMHENSDEEVLSYHEINGDRYENRKIHIMWDSTTRYATENIHSDEIYLSPERVPSLDELKQLDDDEFRIYEISKEEFEHVWQIVTSSK